MPGQAPAFRNPDGTTRIAGIWDQTIQAEDPASWFLNYGTVYTEEQINQALFSSNSLELLPTEDLDGHGTLLASIAGGTLTLLLDLPELLLAAAWPCAAKACQKISETVLSGAGYSPGFSGN